MPYLPTESFIMQRLEGGGCRVIYRQADLTDVPIADFVSYRDAEEWVRWKSGQPRINPYAIELDAPLRPVEVAIEPRSKVDQEKLVAALLELANQDPAFGLGVDKESGQIILKGTGETHLDARLEHAPSRRQRAPPSEKRCRRRRRCCSSRS